MNEHALKDTLCGKPGEFRNDVKTNRNKFVNRDGLRNYEYVLIRFGFLAKRQGVSQTTNITAVSILYRFRRSVKVTVEQGWGGYTFRVGSWCMEFGEVVEWSGLYKWAIKADVSESLVDTWVEAHCC